VKSLKKVGKQADDYIVNGSQSKKHPKWLVTIDCFIHMCTRSNSPIAPPICEYLMGRGQRATKFIHDTVWSGRAQVTENGITVRVDTNPGNVSVTGGVPGQPLPPFYKNITKPYVRNNCLIGNWGTPVGVLHIDSTGESRRRLVLH
jgi:hypothetical protein